VREGGQPQLGPEDLRRLLAPYAWDVVLGAVHWVGAFLTDSEEFLDEWQRRDIDALYAEYGQLLTELAGSGMADVLAHPDRPQLCGNLPTELRRFQNPIIPAARPRRSAIELKTNALRAPMRERLPAPPRRRRARWTGHPCTSAPSLWHFGLCRRWRLRFPVHLI